MCFAALIVQRRKYEPQYVLGRPEADEAASSVCARLNTTKTCINEGVPWPLLGSFLRPGQEAAALRCTS